MNAAGHFASAGVLYLQSAAPDSSPSQWGLGHFPTLLLCAILVSAVFACVFHSSTKERLLATVRYFLLLVFFSLAFGWLMLPFSH